MGKNFFGYTQQKWEYEWTKMVLLHTGCSSPSSRSFQLFSVKSHLGSCEKPEPFQMFFVSFTCYHFFSSYRFPKRWLHTLTKGFTWARTGKRKRKNKGIRRERTEYERERKRKGKGKRTEKDWKGKENKRKRKGNWKESTGIGKE